MMWSYGGTGWSWLLMSLAGLLFLVGIAFFVAWAARASGARPEVDSALDVLRRRLAAGEITPDDFEKTKRALSE